MHDHFISMSGDVYLVCMKCKAAINVGTHGVGSQILDKYGLSEYNQFKPDWQGLLTFISPHVLLRVQAFLIKHFDCRIIASRDEGDLPWETELGETDLSWIVVEW